VNFSRRIEHWREEAKSLNVVHVQMGKQYVDPSGGSAQGRSKVTNTAAGVEDEQTPVSTAHFHARGVPPVARRLGTWSGE
jgi:hypothetical protein